MIFVIDFDGTLALDDTVDALLEAHADPAWRTLESDWLADRITAQECMRQQIGLLRRDRLSLESYFSGIRIDPDFAAFRDQVSGFAHVAIVSDGLDHAIHCALRHAGQEGIPVYANRLGFLPDDRLELSFPYLSQDCASGNGVCKCAVARKLVARHGGPLVLIGDGKSDACLAGVADLVFAKDSLARHCAKERIAYTPFENFADVGQALRAGVIDTRKFAVA